MILRSLTVTDFGTYRAENRIDLTPEPDRPIVLVGGSNGAGKTTLLESILLCLHGRRALGAAVSLRDYEAHIASRIHRPPDGEAAPQAAALALVLDHTESGETSEYLVERTWKSTRTGRVQESLYLARDGGPVDDLPESSWQDFLDGLVPPGVANLFLFDGEQIQALAEDETGEQLGEAVRRLLGLDIVGQLGVDLGRYVAKTEGHTENSLGADLVSREEDLRGTQEVVCQLKEERDELSARRTRKAEAAGRERERFAQQGGTLANERAALEHTHSKATERALTAAAEVRELVAGVLPFAICPDLAVAVEERLHGEQVHEENEILRRRLAEVRGRLSRAVTAKGASKSTARTIEEILLGPESNGVSERVHDLTASERAVLADQLRRAQHEVPRLAKAAAKRLSRADEERTRTRELLDKAPETSAVSDLLEKLQKLEREAGRLDAELARVDETLHAANHETKLAERELRRAHDALRSSYDLAHRSGLALRAASVLEQFAIQVQTKKLKDVELETARYFNRLSRKGELLSAVRMDPESFQMSLKRWDGTELPKQRLSAGEKQLLAIAVLWALAKVSGRPLPVVIDTPLARLDQEHRDRLLKEYFPRVSHQVIVLSTDTEVDAAAARQLAPSIVRSFHLDHDPAACRTVVNDGYFFPTSEAASAG